MSLGLVVALGITLANPEGKEARCATPITREEASALMRDLPRPRDFGAAGALNAVYDRRLISLVEFCARRYELAGYSRRIQPDPGAAAGQAFSHPTYPWTVSYPAGWKLDARNAADIRVAAPDGGALCGVHSAEVRAKTLEEYVDQMQSFNEKYFKERGVMLTGTGRRPYALANGVAGIEVITDMSNGGRSRRIYSFAEPVGYVIDCETYTASWEKFEPVFARIIASLAFRKP